MTMSGDVVSFGADMQLSGVEQFLQGIERADRKARELRRELKAAADEKKKFRQQLKQVGTGAQKAGRAIGGLARTVGGLAKTVGIANVAVLGLGAAAVDKFGDFELQVARIGTLLPEGVNAMEEFGEGALRASIEYGQSIESVTDSIFQSLSKGVTQDKMGDFNQVVGEAAVGGFIEANVAVNGLTNTVNGFGLAIEDARLVSDKFFIANKLGDTTFGKLAATMGNVSSNAKNAGISLDEVLASVVAVTQVGVETSSVMAGLNGIINAIQKPTTDAEGEFERLGLTMNAGVLKAKGLKGVMADLKRALDRDGTPASLANIFGDVEARKVAARVLSEEGFGSLTNALNELGAASGATEKAFTRVADTVGFKMQQIKAGLSAAVIQTGAGLAEGLGLNEAEGIPEKMERAGLAMKGGAKSFAEGFREGFAPVIDAANADWDGLARTLGNSAGKITSAFVAVGNAFANSLDKVEQVARAVGTAFATLAEFIHGDNTPVTRAIKSTGHSLVIPDKYGALLEEDPLKRAAMIRASPNVGWLTDTAQQLFEQINKTRANGGMAMTRSAQRALHSFDVGARVGQGVFERGLAAHANRLFSPAAGTAAAASLIGETQRGYDAQYGSLLNNITVELNQYWKQDGKTKKKTGGAFNYRGTGDAKIRSTIEQQYVIFDDQLIPISDEFHYQHYYEGE